MFQYTWLQWLFFFFFYCFFGWCFESTYCSIKNHKLTNRGFIRGPFLPLYGSGAIVLLVVSRPFVGNWILTYLAGCVGATVLEYFTGVCMEKLFKVRYWDYSNQKLNFQGHICLTSTLAWGGLTLLVTKVVHVFVEKVVFFMPASLVNILAIITLVYFTVDFTLSFKAALDLRDALYKVENIKHELYLMQRRMDVLIAVAGDDFDRNVASIKEGFDENVASIKEGFDENVASIKEDFDENVASLNERRKHLAERFAHMTERMTNNEFTRESREELLKLQGRFLSIEDRLRQNRGSKAEKRRNRILRGNPNMASKRYADALAELKKRLEEKK